MNRLKNNWQRKLISLAVGFLLWSYVTAAVNPTQSLVLRDVAIEVHNQESLEAKKCVITKIEPQVVSVRVAGKRNDLGTVTAKDVKAVIDAANLEEGTHVAYIKYDRPSNVVIDQAATNAVTVSIEKIVTRNMDITVEESGQISDDYMLESIISTPQTIEVTGARSSVNSVAKLIAKIDVDNLSKDRSSNVKVIPVDEDGKEIKDVKLSLSSVNIALSVLKQKEVPIIIDTAGEAVGKIGIKSIQVQPSTLRVKGKSAAIDKLVNIKTETVDLSSITEDIEKDIDVIFPDNVAPVEDVKQVKLGIKLEKMQDSVYEIPFTQIDTSSLPEIYSLIYDDKYKVMNVTLNGLPSKLEKIKRADIKVSLELETVREGRLSLIPVITVPDGVELKSSNPETVDVIIKTR